MTRFRRSLIVSVLLHIAFVVFMPDLWFSPDEDEWIQVSIQAFPDDTEAIPDISPGKIEVEDFGHEHEDIQKEVLNFPEEEIGVAVPSDEELPDFERIDSVDPVFQPRFEEPEKELPGSEDHVGLLDEEGDSDSFNITGPVSSRRVVRTVSPKYPAWAEEKGIEGEVEVKFWVSPEGIVNKLALVKTSGYPDFDSRAIEAVRKYLFEPVGRSEKREDQWGTVTIKYFLK